MDRAKKEEKEILEIYGKDKFKKTKEYKINNMSNIKEICQK
jgi:hypothetical protein